MTTNPTLGTGATAKGRFKIIGSKTVQVDIEFTTGTSGFQVEAELIILPCLMQATRVNWDTEL